MSIEAMKLEAQRVLEIIELLEKIPPQAGNTILINTGGTAIQCSTGSSNSCWATKVAYEAFQPYIARGLQRYRGSLEAMLPVTPSMKDPLDALDALIDELVQAAQEAQRLKGTGLATQDFAEDRLKEAVRKLRNYLNPITQKV